jgi:hypothetical protein
MSRAITGNTPMKISATFASSSTPSVMNRIGNIASGGIIDRKVRNGARARHAREQADVEPEQQARSAASPRPIASRAGSSACPRASGTCRCARRAVNAMRCTASTICPAVGSSLSSGFAAWRACERSR